MRTRRGLAAAAAMALMDDGVSPAAPVYWFNLRGTEGGPTGFVGDGPNDTFLTGLVYPENTIGPFTGGQVVAAGGGSFSNTSGFGAYPHQAGRAPYNAGIDTRTTRISGLVSGQDYRVYLSMGVPGAAVTSQISIYSGNRTGLLHSTANASIPSGSFADVMGTVFASVAAWEAGQASVDLTAASDSLYFARTGTNNGYINAIGIQAL